MMFRFILCFAFVICWVYCYNENDNFDYSQLPVSGGMIVPINSNKVLGSFLIKLYFCGAYIEPSSFKFSLSPRIPNPDHYNPFIPSPDVSLSLPRREFQVSFWLNTLQPCDPPVIFDALEFISAPKKPLNNPLSFINYLERFSFFSDWNFPETVETSIGIRNVRSHLLYGYVKDGALIKGLSSCENKFILGSGGLTAYFEKPHTVALRYVEFLYKNRKVDIYNYLPIVNARNYYDIFPPLVYEEKDWHFVDSQGKPDSDVRVSFDMKNYATLPFVFDAIRITGNSDGSTGYIRKISVRLTTGTSHEFSLSFPDDKSVVSKIFDLNGNELKDYVVEEGPALSRERYYNITYT